MNDNNYVLLPQVKIGFIYNHIQTVVPFVLDESLDVYNLLKKLVDYCNELGARSNELQYILKDLVDFLNNKLNEQKDYINTFLETLHQEWLDYKQSLENKYDEFTEQVDELFEQYKTQIRDEYNSELANIRTNNDTLYNNLKKLLDNKIIELTNYANSIEGNIDNYIDEKDQAIRELITNFQNEFTEYQKTVNNDLIELGDTLTELINTNEQNVIDQINTKTQEIVNSLDNVNMQELVNEKLNSYDSEQLSDLFTNLYGTLIRITYMDTNTPPTVVSETPIYHYNPDTGVLTDCTTGNEASLLSESLYLYEGRLFVPNVNLKYLNTIDVTTNNTFNVFYNDEFCALTMSSSRQTLFIYNHKTNEILYNQVLVDPDGGIQYVYKATFGNDTFYYMGSDDKIYSINLKTKEHKYLATGSYTDAMIFYDNKILLISGNCKALDLTTLEISDYSNVSNNYLEVIPFIDNYYYLFDNNTLYRTRNFKETEVVYENVTSIPSYIFKNGDIFGVTSSKKLYNFDTKELSDKNYLSFVNSINNGTQTTFNINIYINNLVPMQSFPLTNSLTREIYAYMSNYIYLQHDAKLDCYQYTYNLMEIPYQRSDS